MSEHDYLYFKYNLKKFEFYFYYSKNTNFQDLLEYIINNFPEHRVCPCCKFKGIDNNEKKVGQYFKTIGKIFDICLPNNACNCDEIIKNNIRKSRMDIIGVLKKKEKYYINQLNIKENDYKDELKKKEIEINGYKDELKKKKLKLMIIRMN